MRKEPGCTVDDTAATWKNAFVKMKVGESARLNPHAFESSNLK